MSTQLLKDSLEALFNGHWSGIHKIWIACSGGADSVALARALAELMQAKPLTSQKAVCILHFNHQMRGAESEGDQAFVEKLGVELGFPVHVERLEWFPGERRSQTTARNKRRSRLVELLGARDVLLLGHHADDQAETLLFRLLRGTGVRGLQGMRQKHGALWRPFLRVQRSQIRSALVSWNQAWREDSSNQKKSYDRNWLRLEIIPKLEARRPGVSRRLAELAEMMHSELSSVRSPALFIHPEQATLLTQSKLQASKLSELALAFNLETKGARALQKILMQPEWQFTAKNYVISCSQGFVLVVPKGWRSERVKELLGQSYVLRSELGVWRVKSDSLVAWRSELGKGHGTKVKRRAQKLAIPRFWRDAIPLTFGINFLWPERNAQADFFGKQFAWTINSEASATVKVRFSPSPLALSWLKETRPSS